MSSAPTTDIIHQSDTLLARRVSGFASTYCIVTFAAFEDSPIPDRLGFGETFLQQLQVDAIHVIPVGNHWYQYADMEAMCAKIREAVAGYHKVIAYGCSMGGYAAIRFGGWVGAQTALALSPQFSVAARRRAFGLGWRDHVEGDWRWRAFGRGVQFRHETRTDFVPEAFIAYDPLTQDKQHAELYQDLTDVTLLPVPYSGHPSVVTLIQAGVLTSVFSEICWGTFDAETFCRDIEARTRTTPQYAIERATHAINPLERYRLATAAREAFPKNPSVMRLQAEAALLVGRFGAALEITEDLLAAEPDFAPNLYLLHDVHARSGRLDQAIEILEALTEVPHHPPRYDEALKRLKRRRRLARLFWRRRS